MSEIHYYYYIIIEYIILWNFGSRIMSGFEVIDGGPPKPE